MLVISYKLFRIPRMVFLNAKKTNLAVSFNLAVFEVQTKVGQNPRVCWQIFTPENACTSPVLSIWPIIGQLLIWAKNPIAKPFSSPSRHLRWRARLKVFKTIHYFCNFRRMNSHKRKIALWFLFNDDVRNAICDVIYAVMTSYPPYCPRCIQFEYTKSEAKVVEKWDFQLFQLMSWDHWMVLTSSIYWTKEPQMLRSRGFACV